MGRENKMKSTRNDKKEDGTFHSVNIKHDPQAESARTKFGLKGTENGKDKGTKS